MLPNKLKTMSKLKKLVKKHNLKHPKEKMSYIELAVKDVLEYLDVDYVAEAVINVEHLEIENRKLVNPDFLVGNVAIEVNGNYIHGYGKTEEEMSYKVKKVHEKDLLKKEAYHKLGLDYVIIWEEEIKKDYMKVAENLAMYLGAK